ncbi:MAG: ATP-binding cassette domain-containing protein [Bacteroidota bacterium]
MLRVQNLRKEFDTVVAVDGVSLEVQRGELFGLLGPNGAGKTTTIRTILNIIKPNHGTITFDSLPFTHETWNTIGYLPEERGLYRKSKILNTILYFAALKGVSKETARSRALSWLERFGLQDRFNDKVEELSKGNQQKVQLISALIHEPSLLVLDEPFSGLDPVNQILLKDVLMDLRKKNVAIIFSTHQMEQVEKMCDAICLINKGRIVLEGSLRHVKQQYGKNSVHLEFDGDGAFLAKLPLVKKANIYQNYAELELVNPERPSDLLNHLDGKISLRKFEVVEPSLNSIFIDVVGIPATPQEAESKASTAGGRRSRKPMDKALRKALISLGLTLAITIFVILTRVQSDSNDWMLPAVLLGAVAFSGYKVWDAWHKVREREKSGPGSS